LAVSGTRIEAIGSDQEIALQQPKTRSSICTAHHYSGISDAHTHMWLAQSNFANQSVEPEASITPDNPEVLVERIKAFAAAHRNEKILFGRADSALHSRHASHELLDRAVRTAR